MTHIVRRAVIPASGFGVGMLPAAKAVPHAMLPLVDRPLIQYAVEEALAAGIEEIVIVSSRGKGTIEDHFDYAAELEDTLRRSGQNQTLNAVESSRAPAGVVAYVRQQEPLGLAHALWCARHVIGNEPFAVLTPDEVIQAKTPCLAQMVAAYRETGGNLVAVTPAARSRAQRYGVIAAARRDDRLLAASAAAVGPAIGDGAPKWAAVGRFILSAATIDEFGAEAGQAVEGRPIVDTLARAPGTALRGYAFAGRHFDCGDAIGLFEANIAFTLARADLAPAARNVLARYGQLATNALRSRPVETPPLRMPA